MSYYFVRVPELPKDISHQSGTVELIEYSVPEGAMVRKGDAIAVVKNWWAQMNLRTVGPGQVTKTFFGPHTHIKIGDPIAIVVCDPEDGPKERQTAELEIICAIREKPVRNT
jgi:pyruvate/2-oxoglutarate dehydrogenase complex dihydrolipoamide acyltransferase (E2) component